VGTSSAVVQPVVGCTSVRAESLRILGDLVARLDEVTERAVAAMRAEIPAYRDRDERFYHDVRDQVSRHYHVKVSAFLEERTITPQDVAFVRGAASRRARAGLGLEDYINAFRIGQQVFWAAVVQSAGDSATGHEAALGLALPLMRYCDLASTEAARAYVDFQQYVVADADRERRDLLEHALAGELPTRGPLLHAAQAHGIATDARLMVVTAVVIHPAQDVDAAQVASAVIASAGLQDIRTLVVARQTEIVAVLALGADGAPAALCDRIDALCARLCHEGVALAMGVSTVAAGVAELPRAYQEAHAALDGVAERGGVAALARLSPFEYLARVRSDDTARRLVDPRVRAFLDEDRRRGCALTATIRAFAAADLNLRVAAERLQVHPNTAQYRLRRIEERSGRNPRKLADLLDLLVAIALDDAA
jgi:PucR-like helix-turn-helix protein/diguanylate cyclase with GGDEF domain